MTTRTLETLIHEDPDLTCLAALKHEAIEYFNLIGLLGTILTILTA